MENLLFLLVKYLSIEAISDSDIVSLLQVIKIINLTITNGFCIHKKEFTLIIVKVKVNESIYKFNPL